MGNKGKVRSWSSTHGCRVAVSSPGAFVNQWRNVHPSIEEGKDMILGCPKLIVLQSFVRSGLGVGAKPNFVGGPIFPVTLLLKIIRVKRLMYTLSHDVEVCRRLPAHVLVKE
ncbi:hypothetical protein TNCV_3784331 [Trichonephila clavipes]|nr:hypothetical protein TNCV_3784331 [Trichonephila clavipes]